MGNVSVSPFQILKSTMYFCPSTLLTGISLPTYMKSGLRVNESFELAFDEAITTGTLSPPTLSTATVFLRSGRSQSKFFAVVAGIIVCPCLPIIYLIRCKATGISASGSSLNETLIVSPIPSASNAPIPTALFILPSSPSPASVTPRCNG